MFLGFRDRDERANIGSSTGDSSSVATASPSAWGRVGRMSIPVIGAMLHDLELE
jgi:hypothetical protein